MKSQVSGFSLSLLWPKQWLLIPWHGVLLASMLQGLSVVPHGRGLFTGQVLNWQLFTWSISPWSQDFVVFGSEIITLMIMEWKRNLGVSQSWGCKPLTCIFITGTLTDLGFSRFWNSLIGFCFTSLPIQIEECMLHLCIPPLLSFSLINFGPMILN